MAQPAQVSVEACRACSLNSKYIFRLQDGQTVTVLCGRPSVGVIYKAVSYTWEHTSPLPLKCSNCSAIKRIPMRDSKKLWNILNFVRGGSTIWLDALSIDQDDEKDKKAQLMVMGDIYRQALTASVLLPEGDEQAYQILKKLAIKSDDIVKKHEMVRLLGDVSLDDSEETELALLASGFLSILRQWEGNVASWKYWSRAWTFQEWAMAREIEISFENAPNKEGLENIKNVVVMASTIVGQWKMREARIHDRLQGGLSAQLRVREEAGKDLNLVRRHFPFQDFLVADEEESPELLRQMTYMSSLHSADSGTFVHLSSRHERTSSLRQLLSLALNAMSSSQRHSSHPADMVACWASMCNIEYDYSPLDSFALALHKVLTVLRQRGFKIYNFHVSTVGGETDLAFLKYAAAQKQSTSMSQLTLFGAPIFVGRTDTVDHIKQLLKPAEEAVELPSSFKVHIRLVENAEVDFFPLSQRTTASDVFKELVVGKADGVQIEDVVPMIGDLLDEKTAEDLSSKSLAKVSITVEDCGTEYCFLAWAIVSADIESYSLVVARESLNGTLVLATLTEAGEAELVAYLCMTHQRHGTYLIHSSEDGIVDVIFKNPDLELLDLMANIQPDPALEVAMALQTFDILETVDRATNVRMGLDGARMRVVGAAADQMGARIDLAL